MKKIVSVALALLMLVSAFYAPLSAYSASKSYAEDKLESIQTQTGFVPGKTAVVTGNCYLFVSKVCEKLYGVKYDGEGLYGNFRAKHKTGNYYTVSTYTTQETYPSSSVVEGIISFFIKNAVPGDIIHYGKYTTDTSNTSTHTMIVQCIDNKKIGFYHANYQTTDYAASTCHIDYVYWDSLRKSPTSNVKNSDGSIYSMNSIFYNKMKSTGLGISINRYTNYESLYYLVGATTPIVKVDRTSPYSMRVYWDHIAEATKYQVQYKKKSDSSYTTATSTCTDIEYEIKNLDVGVYYDFRVRAYAVNKWLNWSDVIEKKTLPPTISKVTFTLKSNGISMKWGKRSDITGVRIYKSTSSDGTFTKIKDITNLDTNTYLDKDIEYGKNYYYKFERYLVVGSNTYSTKTDAKKATYTLSTPSLSFENVNTKTVKITLSANGVSDEFKYYLTDSNGKKLKTGSTTKTSVSLDSLTPCSRYKFYAAQSTSVGTGSYTYVSFTALPAKVGGLKTSAVTNGIKLSWSKISDAEGYTVYRSTSKDGTYTQLVKISDAANTSYTDTTVKYKTTYYYRVAAHISSGSTLYYGERSDAKSGKNTVGTISNLRAYCTTPTAIKFKWDKAPNATGYTVQYKVEGGSWTSAGSVKTNSKTISRLKLGKTYYFRVKGYNSVGTGAYTSSISKKTAVPKPKTPTAKLVSKGIKVYYTNESYATGYKIYRATSKSGTYKLVKTIDNNTTSSWTDTSVSYGKGYYYKVLCFRKYDGKTYNSSKSDYVYKKYSLSVPTLSVSANGTTANLSWTKSEGAEKYTVQYKIDGGSYISHTVKNTGFTLPNLKEGSTYYFRVKAVSAKGSSSYCTAKSVTF